MNDELDHKLAVEQLHVSKAKLAIFLLGVTLLIVAAGSIWLSSQRLQEPEWVAPVVAGLVGFIAGGAAVGAASDKQPGA